MAMIGCVRWMAFAAAIIGAAQALAETTSPVPTCTATCKITRQLCVLACIGGSPQTPPTSHFEPSPEKPLSAEAQQCVTDRCEPQAAACLTVCRHNPQ